MWVDYTLGKGLISCAASTASAETTYMITTVLSMGTAVLAGYWSCLDRTLVTFIVDNRRSLRLSVISFYGCVGWWLLLFILPGDVG